jgi:hypothetical protein
MYVIKRQSCLRWPKSALQQIGFLRPEVEALAIGVDAVFTECSGNSSGRILQCFVQIHRVNLSLLRVHGDVPLIELLAAPTMVSVTRRT